MGGERTIGRGHGKGRSCAQKDVGVAWLAWSRNPPWSNSSHVLGNSDYDTALQGTTGHYNSYSTVH
jgi:hypothetical protein